VLHQELCKGVVTLHVTQHRDMYSHHRNICNHLMMDTISSRILLNQEYDSLLQITVLIYNMPSCLNTESEVASYIIYFCSFNYNMSICINISNEMQLYYLGFYLNNSTCFGPSCPSSGVYYCIGSHWYNI
jgi:hypothetical protein